MTPEIPESKVLDNPYTYTEYARLLHPRQAPELRPGQAGPVARQYSSCGRDSHSAQSAETSPAACMSIGR